MKKLAIVSTYDDLCGIAGYTKALVRQLQQDYEVTVCPASAPVAQNWV